MSLPFTFDQLSLITRKGYARSFRRAEVDSLLERGLPLHSSPVAGDYPAFVVIGDGRSRLLIATRSGKGVRFPESQVGVQAKPAIKLDRGDVVAGAAIVDDDVTVVLVAADGVAARREMEGFGAHPMAGNRGKILTRIGVVTGVAPVSPDDVLWFMSSSGRLIPISANRVPSGPGASSGRSVVRLDDDSVVALAVTQGD